VKQPAASKVFQRHRLDFCCHGNRPLQEACDEYGLARNPCLPEIESEGRKCGEVLSLGRETAIELVALHRELLPSAAP
jgi:iron-sulfur cluster repair protein YtfE (RIC family)